MVSAARRTRTLAAAAVSAVVALAACTVPVEEPTPEPDPPLVVGTTDRIVSLDPAGSYDAGSSTVMNQVYPFLMNSRPGESEAEPDIALAAAFDEDGDYTVTLQAGLVFANGNALTASDVKFSFDRQIEIADGGGPSALLGNIERVEAIGDLTIVFHLRTGNDQTLPQVLSSPAAAIVDEQVFSADAITPDAEIVKGEPFAGPYTIASYTAGERVVLQANPRYRGLLGVPEADEVVLAAYADSESLARGVRDGEVDVAYRGLAAADVAALRADDGVRVLDGPGGEIRCLVFNFDTMPYGAKTPGADPVKALAVRQAIASLVDREELVEHVYGGTYAPLYSYVPQGLPGATEVLKELYGDGSGGPDARAAAAVLAAAGVSTPVALDLHYNLDQYGGASGEEYALIARQLETSGLFTVEVGSAEGVQYAQDRVADAYPLYQFGRFPDHSDADTYLTPLFASRSALANHYTNQAVDDELSQQRTETDPAARELLIEGVQARVAADLSTLPLLQGAQTIVVRDGVTGAVLDGSFKFRFGTLSRRS